MNLLAIDHVQVAKRFGTDITKRKFWHDRLTIIGQPVDHCCEL